jgi:hypothetical protein
MMENAALRSVIEVEHWGKHRSIRTIAKQLGVQPKTISLRCKRAGIPLRDVKTAALHRKEAKTHCPQGHAYTPENTLVETRNGQTYRVCRACRKSKDARCRRKRLYGITQEEMDARLEAQGGKCANQFCGATEAGGRGDWHVDHDHITGAVRGLLCHRCNVVLALVSDDIERLRGLILYLTKAKESNAPHIAAEPAA